MSTEAGVVQAGLAAIRGCCSSDSMERGTSLMPRSQRSADSSSFSSSVGFFRMVGKTPHDMFVDVTVAVPNPDDVDTAGVAKELPYGTVTVTAVEGGLDIPAESGGDGILIANAAVLVSLDDGK